MNTTAVRSINSVYRSHVSLAFLLIPLACFAFPPQARAVCQEGCLTGSNTVLGDDALLNNTSFNNTAVGFQALQNNTIGDRNTAIGASALVSNTAGVDNTVSGAFALTANTTGADNTVSGVFALTNNTTGGDNTATGSGALQGNTTGNFNTATGANALGVNLTGGDNTATGAEALQSNTTGVGNTAEGFFALWRNSTGSSNIALGLSAGFNITGSDNIDIGNLGIAGESHTIRIGAPGAQARTFIAGISGATVPRGAGVIVGADGKLGTVLSSARFKEAIKPMDKASEAILALKPVSFRYKHELDPEGISQFGLVAEDVEKVNPDLVARDDHGKPYSVRYEAVNAMLLNEFLKEHREVQEQKATIIQLKSALAQQQKDFQATAAQQQKQIEALTAGFQKVSAQLEVSKAVPQTVLNDQ